MSETSMKPWQQGYPLTELQDIEARYASYNARARGPFSTMKAHQLAVPLAAGELIVGPTWCYRLTRVKVTRPMTLFPNCPWGARQVGDRVVTHLAVDDWDEEAWQQAWARLRQDDPSPLWVQVWAADERARSTLAQQGATWAGAKVNSFGDVFAWYLYAPTAATQERVYHAHTTPVDYHGISAVAVTGDIAAICDQVTRQVDALDIEFANHYSKYNVGTSWGAVSLRGYSSDVRMIEKPSAMNAAWQKKHAHETYRLQDTILRTRVPALEPLLCLFGDDLHWDRIRLMRLTPQGGELQRHTDQVDGTLGVGVGQLMRIHVPLKTNPDVVFTVWDAYDAPVQTHMADHRAWVLDARWPHRALNGGTTERIHLVMDVVTTPDLRDRLYTARRSL